MTTASSTSQSVLTEPRGSTRSSSGPLQAVVVDVVEADADDLAGTADGGTEALRGGDAGGFRPRQEAPGLQALRPVAGEEGLVPVLAEAGCVDARAVLEDHAGFLGPGRAEADQLQVKPPAVRGGTGPGPPPSR